MANPKITFIGAGSSVFMKNIVGDILQREALAGAEIRLMDINPQRLEESAIIAGKLVNTLGVPATVTTYSNQREALDGTNFVVVCFQIGGYEPSTVVDVEGSASGGVLGRDGRGQAPLASSAIRPNVTASRTARSARILRSISMSAFFWPATNWR